MYPERYYVISVISIHALREEGDRPGCCTSPPHGYFYPRPPRGGRPIELLPNLTQEQFLSTPSARRATRPHSGHQRGPSISIHALREEGDFGRFHRHADQRRFLSTPSARRATADRPPMGGHRFHFYPRPPRGGRLLFAFDNAHTNAFLSTPSARRATTKAVFVKSAKLNFYPRPPRGGRLQIVEERENG